MALTNSCSRDCLDLFNTLSQTAEDNVRSFHTALRDARSSAANDLQRNVYRNYPEFVKISKEIANILFVQLFVFSKLDLYYFIFILDLLFFFYSHLEGDMLQLRGFLNELKEINGNLQIEEVAPFDAREITGKLSLGRLSIKQASGNQRHTNKAFRKQYSSQNIGRKHEEKFDDNTGTN